MRGITFIYIHIYKENEKLRAGVDRLEKVLSATENEDVI